MNYNNTSLEFVKNISDDNKVVEMLLFGEIGRGIDGNSFAHEMGMFSEVEEIRININSRGGGIIEGKSIIGAMDIARSKGIKVSTINRGVADSMATFILANGDAGSRVAMNYSSALLHDPRLQGKDGKQVLIKDMDKDDAKSAIELRDGLADILSATTGEDKDMYIGLMKNETRLKAKEMLNFGIVDKIEKANNQPKITENMSAVELMAACADYNNQKPKTMNLVTQLLNLNDDANEASIVAGIKDLQSKSERIDALEARLIAMSEEAEKKETEIKELEEKVKESEEKEVEAIVDSAIESGKYSADSRETLIVNASKDIEMFKSLTESMKPTRVDVTDMISKSDKSDSDKELRMAQDYRNADMKDGGLVEFKNKVGEEKFLSYEEAYSNRLNEL